MNDDNIEDTGSADQDAWINLIQRTRTELGKVVNTIPSMKAEDMVKYVETIRDLFWMHIYANSFDKKIEIEQNRIGIGD